MIETWVPKSLHEVKWGNKQVYFNIIEFLANKQEEDMIIYLIDSKKVKDFPCYHIREYRCPKVFDRIKDSITVTKYNINEWTDTYPEYLENISNMLIYRNNVLHDCGDGYQIPLYTSTPKSGYTWK